MKTRQKRIIKWSIAGLLVLVLVLICVKRWNAWFGNPDEPVYTAITEPGRIQLTFGNNGEFSRNISWQCGEQIVESHINLTLNGSSDTLTINASGKLFETQGGTTVIYYAELKDLNEGAYSYAVQTGDKRSGWYQFAVNGNNDSFSFVYLGDVQDTINSISGNLFTSIHRNYDADFWLLGGDVIERPQDRYWNEYFGSVDSISQTTPFIAIPGNHEYRKGVTRKLEERFIYTFSYFVNSRHKNNTVFSMKYGDATIITLDSNRDFWTLPSQRKWLKQALEQAQSSKWIIVALHHPVYSIRGKMNNLTVRTMFNGLLKKHNVDLVLQGHEHSYARMISKDNDELQTPVYIIGQSSPKDYKINFNDLYDRYGAGQRFFQVVDVNADTLNIKTYTENNALYDNIQLVKTGTKVLVEDLATNIPEQIEINSRTGKVKKAKIGEYEKEIEQWLNRNN